MGPQIIYEDQKDSPIVNYVFLVSFLSSYLRKAFSDYDIGVDEEPHTENPRPWYK